MNLNLLIDIAIIIIIGDLALGLALMYMIINKEYVAKYRRIVFYLATLVWVLIFTTYILYTIIMHYIQLEPYSTIVQVQGHNVTVSYIPTVGLPSISILEMIMVLMIIGTVVMVSFDDVVYQLDVERCGEGEA